MLSSLKVALVLAQVALQSPDTATVRLHQFAMALRVRAVSRESAR